MSDTIITLVATTIRDNRLPEAADLLAKAFKSFTPAQEVRLRALVESGLFDGFDTRMVLEVACGDLLEWVGDRMDALEARYATTGRTWRRHALRCDAFCAIVTHITTVNRRLAA